MKNLLEKSVDISKIFVFAAMLLMVILLAIIYRQQYAHYRDQQRANEIALHISKLSAWIDQAGYQQGLVDISRKDVSLLMDTLSVAITHSEVFTFTSRQEFDRLYNARTEAGNKVSALQLKQLLTTMSEELHHGRMNADAAFNARLSVESGLTGVVLLLLFGAAIFYFRKTKQLVHGLRENEQKFLALLDAAPDATVMVDHTGKIVRVNQRVHEVFGYDSEELIGQPVEVLIPVALKEKHVKHRDNFVQHAGVRAMGAGLELMAVKKNGQNIPVEISLSPIRTPEGMLVSAAIRDISDRKRSEERFRSLLESAPDATVIVNEQGVIKMANNQAEQMFGYKREELVGRKVEMLIPFDLRQKHEGHRANFAHAAKVREMGAGIELRAVKKDGQSFPVEISLSPIKTEEGLLVSAAVRDISSRRKLEDDLRKSHAEMEAFTYSVSHDLRAPLRGIVGFTSILEEEYVTKMDDEARRITSVIKENTLKMGQLIDDLLNFSRTGKLEMIKSVLPTETIVRDVISELEQSDKRAVAVSWKILPLADSWGDRNTIQQVWINLVSNAFKYSGQAQQPIVEIGSYNENEHTIFYIKDNGVGFDQQYHHKLFKVFQRLHGQEEFEGSGVGLALVEKIVSRHGGKVWAEGTPGKGATFFFSLPRLNHTNNN